MGSLLACSARQPRLLTEVQGLKRALLLVPRLSSGSRPDPVDAQRRHVKQCLPGTGHSSLRKTKLYKGKDVGED